MKLGRLEIVILFVKTKASQITLMVVHAKTFPSPLEMIALLIAEEKLLNA
jgi:hypothetical protein